jgi:hypothetical protein
VLLTTRIITMAALLCAGNGAAASGNDYGEVLAKIENLEQNIIQHIRTSGVRKPRETALIDEVMELRRERRKFSSAVHSQLKALDGQNKVLVDEVTELREKLQVAGTAGELTRRKLAESRETDKTQFEERLTKELATQEEKLKFIEKINIAKIRNKYEEQMKEYDLKMKEMFQAKAKAELKDARTIALELVEKAKLEMEKRCNEKLAE